MLLTLPGPAFLYQGDEIGLADGPGGERVYDRAGRDRFRHPMQWDASPSGGFTTGEAWLPPVDPERRTSRRSARTLARRSRWCATCWRCGACWATGWSLLDARPGVLAYRRGDHLIAINTTAEERPRFPRSARRCSRRTPGAFRDGTLGGALRCDYAV